MIREFLNELFLNRVRSYFSAVRNYLCSTSADVLALNVIGTIFLLVVLLVYGFLGLVLMLMIGSVIVVLVIAALYGTFRLIERLQDKCKK